VVLYVDGLASAQGAALPSNGLLSSSSPVSIGSRQSSTSSGYYNQFDGTLDDVAVYSYALSSNQVLAHYFAALLPPVISEQPTNTTAPEGSAAILYSLAYGPAPLAYQWYETTSGGFVPVTDQTGTNLVLANVSGSYNGSRFQVVVTNAYGAVTSAPAILSVVSGPPYYIADLPAEALVLAGSTATFTVTMGGTAPFTYRWQKGGVDLSDTTQITGSHSNILTIVKAQPGDSGTYQVLVSNSAGGPVASLPEALTVQGALSFNNDGLGWSLNNGATLASNALTLTDGASVSEARSSFFSHPVYIGAFEASFIYQDVGAGGADGMAFVVQNSTQGAAARGGYGGGLGYLGITPSIAIELNLYTAAPGGRGYAFGQNGLNAGPYSPTDPVNIANGNPINVNIQYANGNLELQLSDPASNTAFSTSLNIGSLPALLGTDTAYVGLSGGDGGIPSTQVVSNFTFVSYTALALQTTATNTLVFSWPVSALGYELQQNSDLATTNWVKTAGPVNVVGGQNQVVVPLGSAKVFYRLRLQ
jgi:hypothetical protein